MTTLPRHDRHLQQAAEVIRWWQRIQGGWPTFLICWATLFQAVAAVTLAFAPWDQLLTPGTRPVLEMAPRYVWAVLFAVAATVTGASPWMRPVARYLGWIFVLALGGSWLASFAANVFSAGKGSALGIAAWFFLYVPIAAVALHQGLRKR